MGSEFDNLSSRFNVGESEKDGVQKISVSDHVNGLQQTTDSIVVDVERFSHLVEKDINANSRFTLQRNLSRKGSGRSGSMLTTSPRATLHGGGGGGGGSSTPENPIAAPPGPTDPSIVPEVHHHITIANGNITGIATAAENKLGVRQSSFRRTMYSGSNISPRRILLLFATLSSMGTILLIYFTLSMSKINGVGDSTLD